MCIKFMDTLLDHFLQACNIFQGYFDGIVGNLMLVPIYYPGWVMRLYYDLEDGDTITKVRYTQINNTEFMTIILMLI